MRLQLTTLKTPVGVDKGAEGEITEDMPRHSPARHSMGQCPTTTAVCRIREVITDRLSRTNKIPRPRLGSHNIRHRKTIMVVTTDSLLRHRRTMLVVTPVAVEEGRRVAGTVVPSHMQGDTPPVGHLLVEEDTLLPHITVLGAVEMLEVLHIPEDMADMATSSHPNQTGIGEDTADTTGVVQIMPPEVVVVVDGTNLYCFIMVLLYGRCILVAVSDTVRLRASVANFPIPPAYQWQSPRRHLKENRTATYNEDSKIRFVVHTYIHLSLLGMFGTNKVYNVHTRVTKKGQSKITSRTEA